MTRAPSKPVQLARLCIDHTHYLLPTDKAMKVMELMQNAVRCDLDYSSRSDLVFVPREGTPELEISLIRPSQIRMPEGEVMPVTAKPRLLR